MSTLKSTQDAQMKSFEHSYEAFIDSFSGASGGVLASLIFYPIENFRTRVQTINYTQDNEKQKEKKDDTPASDSKDKTPIPKQHKHRPLLTILQQIINEEGFLALYKGLKVALFGTIASYGIYFWWYRYLKNQLARYLKRD